MSEVLFKAKFPVPKFISKKNAKKIAFNRKTSKSFIMTESKTAFIERWILQKLATEKLKQRIDTISGLIHVSFVLTYPKSVYFTKKGTVSNKVMDISNSIQAFEDCLEKAGIIENDRNIASLDGTRREYHDDNSYWVEITIKRFT